jgi:type IV pilus assembly protein PilA
MFNKKGFTLVELMIVVAIIGILAAIAIPNFVAMQYRAKRSEVPSNVDGIKTAELAYDAAFDRIIPVTATPSAWSAGLTAKEQAAWPAGSAFDTLGWGPDGMVRGQYEVPAGEITSTNFRVHGRADVDGDSTPSSFTATKTINTTMVSANNIY